MGCGESKHAVATTESLSTRKKLSSNSIKKPEKLEVSFDAKVYDEADKIPSTTLEVVEKQETQINVRKDDNVTKQSEDNTSMNDEIRKDLVLESKEQEEEDTKEIEVAKSVVALETEKQGHERESSLESQDEYLSVSETKSENICPQNETTETCTSNVGEKQDDLVDGDNISSMRQEENVNSGNIENMIEAKEEVKDVGSATETETTKVQIEGSAVETETTKVENEGSAVETETTKVENEGSAVEMETTPKAEQEDVMIATDERIGTPED